LRKTDFILIGQGIAGTVLALELMNEGKSVVVIDDPQLSASSRVAAGIYNPVVFKRLTQSWLAEIVLPAMMDFYSDLEIKLGVKLLHPVKIARLFANSEEETLWKKKSVNELTEFIDGDVHDDLIFSKDHYAYVKQAGYLDMAKFLGASRDLLEKRNSLLNERFDHQLVKFEGDHVLYKNLAATKLIFCEGHLSRQNPWFGHIKFKPAKGEVLTIYCPELNAASILNKDIFILPLPEEHLFKVGATYDWDELNDEATPEAREELEEKIKKMIPFPFHILKQEAGVRPSTIDRRPVMGFHAEHKNLGVFNGFGTKGVMLAPYFAKHFCSFMENKTSLWQEVDIKRFSPVKTG